MFVSRTARTVLAVLGALAIAAPAVDAANLPVYDVNLARQRFIPATDVAATQTYADTPVYLEFPAGQQSFSTPTVVGNTLYQYTFDPSSGQGHLYNVALPTITYQQLNTYVQTPGNPTYYAQPITTANPPVTFHGTAHEVSGQDSLSTNALFQAIGVGQYLYTWQQSSYPTGGTLPTGVFIRGNPGNTNYQVDENPLITPTVTVNGFNASFQPVSWSSPVAVVGSWDGGLIAYPTYVPSGDTPNRLAYLTSYDYPNDSAALTSDPTWVGNVPGVGSNCVAFGVADSAHPRVIVLDVTTGQYVTIGVGQIAGQVADTVLLDNTGPQAGHPLLVVQDIYGALYTFTLSGALQAVYAPSNWTNFANLILGADLSLLNTPSGQELFAIGGGGNLLGVFNPSTLAPLAPPTGAYGPGYAPVTALTDTHGGSVIAFNNTSGNTWLMDPRNLTQGFTPGTVWTDGFPPTSSWIGIQPDAGPQHWIIGWTNSDPNGKPAIVAFVPAPYAATDNVAPLVVNSGQAVTLYGFPSPAGVTNDNGQNPYATHGSPVLGYVYDSQGHLVAGPLPMQRHTGSPTTLSGSNLQVSRYWATTWTPPRNTTNAPVTYSLVVTAVSETGQTAQAAPTVFTVEPEPPAGGPGTATLSLACGYGHGQMPIVVGHSCTIPANETGQSAAFFAYHPQYGAKFGDTVAATLTLTPPKLPALPGAQVDSVQITASSPHPAGIPNLPGYAGYNPGDSALYHYSTVTTALTQTGTWTATGHFVESWAGYPPPQPLGTTVWQGDVTVDWRATVNWSYLKPIPPFQNCQAPNPLPGQPAACTDLHHWQRVAGTPITLSGQSRAPLTINGTDYYVIATPLGY